MKTFRNMMIAFVVIMTIAILTFVITYKYNISAISNDKKEIILEIPYGTSRVKIGQMLVEKKLVRNEYILKLYLKLNDVTTLQAGTYSLNRNMSLEEIVDTLEDGRVIKNTLMITFKEGKTIKDLALVIENKTKYSKEEVLNTLSDKEYLKELITKYWFIKEDVLNTKLYFPLEGYLYPNTYDVYGLTVKQIIETILNQTDKVLTKYKVDIEKSEFSVHEFLTFASLVELEAKTDESRASVAAVFYNRLDVKMALGSDVTTYYAEQKTMKEDLFKAELDELNDYNTRNANFTKLPIGPIASPSESSIKASLNPANSTYLYFVADKNGKVYLMKTYQEHLNKVAELKAKGLWFTYD